MVENSPAINIGEEITISAIAGASSRTELVDGAESVTVMWSAEDEIALFHTAGTPEKYTTAITESAAAADFSGIAVDAELPFALYPYDEVAVADYTANTVTLNLWATQYHCPESTYSLCARAIPLLAKSDATGANFAFESVCGVLSFNIVGSGEVEQIAFKSSTTEMLAGDVVVDMSATPSVKSASVAEVILNCGDEGVALSDEQTMFSVVLAPTTEPVKFQITMTDGTKVAYATDGPIVANKVLTVGSDITIEATSTDTTPAVVNILTNGDFETGSIDSSVTGTAGYTTCELVDGSANPVDGNNTYFLSIANNGGTENVHARININFPAAIGANDEYELSFRACSTLESMEIIEFGLWSNGGWVTGASRTFTLTQQWSTVTMKIDNTGWWTPASYVGADMLALNFGTFDGVTVYIDDVVLVKTAGDDAVTPPSDEEVDIISLSDFSSGIWAGANGDGTHGGSKGIYGAIPSNDNGTVSVVDGALKFDIISPTANAWDVQLAVKPAEAAPSIFTTFEAGKTYTFSFDIKSDNGTSIGNVHVQNATYGYVNPIGNDGGTIHTTTDWVTHTYTVDAVGGLTIVFQIGAYTDAFYFKNISLSVK